MAAPVVVDSLNVRETAGVPDATADLAKVRQLMRPYVVAMRARGDSWAKVKATQVWKVYAAAGGT